jgi:hypothetical protein
VKGLSILASVLGALALGGLARAETAQQGKLRVAFSGEMSPNRLPRFGLVPVSVSLGGAISTTEGSQPPQLQKIEIAVNRYGRIAPGALPSCPISQIQPASTEGALEACPRSVIGTGSFQAKVLLPEQSPFPSRGQVYAYNGTYEGRPAILAHVYGTQPAPTSYTLPFVISERAKGAYGTVLRASLPQVTSKWGYVTGLSLRLSGSGAARGFLRASCPAPRGFSGAVFPLAHSTFAFAGGIEVGATLQRSCRVQG